MRRRLFKNFLFLATNNVLMPVASLALIVVISRIGGAKLLGEYSYLVAFLAMTQTVASAGLDILITRDVAHQRDLAGTYLTAACVIGLCAVVLAGVVITPWFVLGVDGGAVRLALVVLTIALVPSFVITFCEAILLGFEHARDFVTVAFTETLLRSAVATALVWYGYGIMAIALTILVMRGLSAIALLAFVKARGVQLAWRVDRKQLARFARQTPVVGAIPFVNALYWRSGTLLLTWIAGLVPVGYYSAAYRVFDMMRTLPQAYVRAAYPVLSRLHQASPEEFATLCRDSLRWISIITLGVALLVSGAARWIVVLLYGAEFAPSILPLQILVFTMLPYAITATLAQVLFATSNQAYDLRVNTIATVVSIAANVIFIPLYGLVAAAAVALAATCLHAGLQYNFVRCHVIDPHFGGALLRTLAAAGLGAVVLFVLPLESVVVALVGALAVYLAALAAAGLLRKSHVIWLYDRVVARTA